MSLKIFLTGVTGLVGASVVTAILRDHDDLEIVALCRPSKGLSAEDRVVKVLHDQCAFDSIPEQADKILSHIKVISGDIKDFPKEEILAQGPYDVFFHCAVGTDRTGTVAYLIEGILGVPLGERLDDYELSYFYRETSGHGSTRKKVRDGSLYKKVNQYSSNSKEQEKFMNWYLDGLSNKESELTLINNFRKAMINGNPTIYTLSNGKVKAQ